MTGVLDWFLNGQDPATLPPWYWAVTGALLGGVLASFAAVVIERLPRGESLLGRSRCACGRPLRVRENIPVVGWIAARGVASCCGAVIPRWYAAVEAGAAGACAVAGGAFGPAGVVAALGVGAVATVLATVLRTRRA